MTRSSSHKLLNFTKLTHAYSLQKDVIFAFFRQEQSVRRARDVIFFFAPLPSRVNRIPRSPRKRTKITRVLQTPAGCINLHQAGFVGRPFQFYFLGPLYKSSRVTLALARGSSYNSPVSSLFFIVFTRQLRYPSTRITLPDC